MRQLFVVVYQYKIPKDKTIQYFKLEKKAIEIYLEKGCVAVEIYRDIEAPEKWMEINRFEDKEHYERVVATLNDDQRISSLFKEFQEVLKEEEYDLQKNYYLQII